MAGQQVLNDARRAKESQARLDELLQSGLLDRPVRSLRSHAQIAEFVNNEYDHSPEKGLLRDWLRPDAPPNQQISAKTIGRQLKRHLDEPVMSGKRALTLRAERNPHTEVLEYYVAIKERS